MMSGSDGERGLRRSGNEVMPLIGRAGSRFPAHRATARLAAVMLSGRRCSLKYERVRARADRDDFTPEQENVPPPRRGENASHPLISGRRE